MLNRNKIIMHTETFAKINNAGFVNLLFRPRIRLHISMKAFIKAKVNIKWFFIKIFHISAVFLTSTLYRPKDFPNLLS